MSPHYPNNPLNTLPDKSIEYYPKKCKLPKKAHFFENAFNFNELITQRVVR